MHALEVVCAHALDRVCVCDVHAAGERIDLFDKVAHSGAHNLCFPGLGPRIHLEEGRGSLGGPTHHERKRDALDDEGEQRDSCDDEDDDVALLVNAVAESQRDRHRHCQGDGAAEARDRRDEAATEVRTSLALLRATIECTDRENDRVVPDEAGKDHRDIDRGDENESAGERCLRNAGNDARQGDAHHEKEDGVEQEGRDGPEGAAEGTQVHHVGADTAP